VRRSTVARGLFILALVSLGLAIGLSAVVARVALAAHDAPPGTYFSININEDWFENWDHETAQTGADTVDWPVTFLFYGNSTVNRVKNIYWGQCPADPMHLFVLDVPTFGWQWDDDRGTKNHCIYPYLGVALHMRVYGLPGLDSYFNLAWGFYVLATVHSDVNEGLPGALAGYSEWTEDQIIPIAQAQGQGVIVWQDWAYFWNRVIPWVQVGNHIVESDGWGHAVFLPACPNTPGC
jgi:hypothetical protein